MPTSLLGAYWCVPSVTIGVTAKFSVGGGDGISHSSPFAPHGFGAGFLAGEQRARQVDQRQQVADARIDAPAVDITFSTWNSGGYIVIAARHAEVAERGTAGRTSG